MWPFGERFPYTDTHQLNLDWIIKIIKEITSTYPGRFDALEQAVNNKMPLAINQGENGNILVNIGNGESEWQDFSTAVTEQINEAVSLWLDEHPEATTTVQDGTISYNKLNTDMKTKVDSASFVNNFSFPTTPFISMANGNYGGSQGMCVIDNKYIVICRYYGNNQRAFRIYNAITKEFINESFLLDSQVGHVNSMTYYEGYIYVSTLEEGSGIAKLRFNELTMTISYDSIACATMYPSFTIINGNVYAMRYVADGYWGCYVMDMTFDGADLLFTNNLAGTAENAAIQGMTTDGKYIYLAFSGDYSNGSGDDENRFGRYTEYVYVFDMNGATVKTFYFSRGTYSEIEDIDFITVENNKYLVISLNRNNANVANVYIIPVFNNTEPITQFMTADINGSFNSEVDTFTVYVDAENADDFPDGTAAHPFPNPASALSYIRRTGAPAVLKIISGSFSFLWVQNIPTPLTIFFDGGYIENVHIRRCGTLVFDRSSGATGTKVGKGGIIVDESSVFARYSVLDIDGTGTSYETAIKLYRALYCGSIGLIKNYHNAIVGINSICNVLFTMENVVNEIVTGSTITGTINGTLYPTP